MKNETTTLETETPVQGHRANLYRKPFHDLFMDAAHNPREDYKDLPQLAQSIQENGIIVPLTVTLCKGKYRIAHGFRRFAACQLLMSTGGKIGGDGLIPCLIAPPVKGLAEGEIGVAEILNHLVQNSGEPMNILEQAKCYSALLKGDSVTAKWTQEKIAKSLGLTQGHVSSVLNILKAPQEFRNAVQEGKIAGTKALEIWKIARGDQEVAVKTLNNLMAAAGDKKITQKTLVKTGMAERVSRLEKLIDEVLELHVLDAKQARKLRRLKKVGTMKLADAEAAARLFAAIL